MEKSTVNAFLDSNNVYSTVNIERMYSWLVDTTPTNEMEVYLSILEKDPTAARNELTEAEYNEYWKSNNKSKGWLSYAFAGSRYRN